MDISELNLWLERVSKRKNLHPMMKEKYLVLEFYDEDECVSVELNGTDIQVIKNPMNQAHVSIQASQQILHSLWCGNKRLLTIPPHLIRVRGHYRELLFVEALFHLASKGAAIPSNNL